MKGRSMYGDGGGRKRKRTQRNYLPPQRTARNSLPRELRDLSETDIFFNIFLRLPMKSLLICRRVCRNWRRIISDPEFAKQHLRRSAKEEVVLRQDGPAGSLSRTLQLVDPDQLLRTSYAQCVLPFNDDVSCAGVEVLNSCNGLFCLCNCLDKNPVFIWNPITREYVNIPRTDENCKNVSLVCKNPIGCDCSLCLPWNEIESHQRLVASGFGFSSKTNEHKLLRIFEGRFHHGFGNVHSYGRQAEIYILNGKESWKGIDFFPRIDHSFSLATYLKGTMYWACAKDGKFDFLVTFNFQNHEFKFVPLPNYSRTYEKDMRMLQLRGCLSICDFSPAGYFDIWFMKDGVLFPGKKWWRKEYAVRLVHAKVIEPIRFLNDEEILMCIRDSRRSLVVYNFSKMKLVREYKMRSRSCFEASSHIISFVSLKEIVKGGRLEVLIAGQGEPK